MVERHLDEVAEGDRFARWVAVERAVAVILGVLLPEHTKNPADGLVPGVDPSGYF